MYDDIMGPPCQVPYNTLLWGKKFPSNTTGVGGSCKPHCCWHANEPSSLRGRTNTSYHGDWLDSNILSIYTNMIATLDHFFLWHNHTRTTETISGLSRWENPEKSSLGTSGEIVSRVSFPYRTPLVSLLSTYSCCPHTCWTLLESRGVWVATVDRRACTLSKSLHEMGPGAGKNGATGCYWDDNDYKN